MLTLNFSVVSRNHCESKNPQYFESGENQGEFRPSGKINCRSDFYRRRQWFLEGEIPGVFFLPSKTQLKKTVNLWNYTATVKKSLSKSRRDNPGENFCKFTVIFHCDSTSPSFSPLKNHCRSKKKSLYFHQTLINLIKLHGFLFT